MRLEKLGGSEGGELTGGDPAGKKPGGEGIVILVGAGIEGKGENRF